MQLTLFDVTRTHGRQTPLLDTKRAAYREHKLSGNAAAQEMRVLECIRSAGDRGITRQDIAASTGIPLASVCGRVNRLLGLKEVEHRKGRVQGKRSLVFIRKGRRHDS